MMQTAAPDVSAMMPKSIVRMAETIGWVAALKLIQCVPGRRMYVPSKLKADDFLVQMLGQEAADKLVKFAPGQEIFIPKAKRRLLAIRNARIVEDYNAGITVPELVSKYDLTDRHIYSLLGAPVVECIQLELGGFPV